MTRSQGVRRSGFGALFGAALAGCLATSCVFLDVEEQQRRLAEFAELSGTVETEGAGTAPLVVVLIRPSEPAGEAGDEARESSLRQSLALARAGADASPGALPVEIADHFVRSGTGRFFFTVSSGEYALAAFEDLDGDLRFDPGEPALAVSEETIFQLGPGETRHDIPLRIPPSGRSYTRTMMDVGALQARTVQSQLRASVWALSAIGDVAQLSDERFDPANASMGLWRPVDFMLDVGPGVYFLEPFDPDKIPVLFVHGMSGHPREFAPLIESLDRSRFQPWVYFYPSGIDLAGTAEHLARLVAELQVRRGFDRLFVVAHSMGGLVARAFIQEHFEETSEPIVERFVTLSTPWAGHAAAQRGVDEAPAVVLSWIDMAPGSDFLSGLFYADPQTREQRETLPGHVEHHLLFGFSRNTRRLGPSDDHVVTVASQLRPEAQAEATRSYGLDATHSGILLNPGAAEIVNRVLDEALR